jgi:uncharacterized membrane protein
MSFAAYTEEQHRELRELEREAGELIQKLETIRQRTLEILRQPKPEQAPAGSPPRAEEQAPVQNSPPE